MCDGEPGNHHVKLNKNRLRHIDMQERHEF